MKQEVANSQHPLLNLISLRLFFFAALLSCLLSYPRLYLFFSFSAFCCFYVCVQTQCIYRENKYILFSICVFSFTLFESGSSRFGSVSHYNVQANQNTHTHKETDTLSQTHSSRTQTHLRAHLIHLIHSLTHILPLTKKFLTLKFLEDWHTG